MWRWSVRGVMAGLAVAVLVLGAPAGRSVRAQPALVDCEVDGDVRALTETESQMLDLINAYRASFGLPALALDPTLEREARWKAQRLTAVGPRELGLDDHDDPGRTWDQRFLDCGYPASAGFAENLGGSDADNATLIEAWKASPAHDINLRNPAWTHIGLARAGEDPGYGYWALAFGDAATE